MSGVETTFEFLAETLNESASDLLIETLDASDRPMRERALTAILQRKTCRGHSLLLHRWHSLSDRWKSMIADHSSRVVDAMQDAIHSANPALQANGCDAALWCREYEMAPELMLAADDAEDPKLATRAGKTLVRLCESLSEEVFGQRDVKRRRDPTKVRRFVIAELEKKLRQPAETISEDVMESFLLLATKETSFLRQALDNPKGNLGAALTQQLKVSNRPSVMRLLIELLEAPRLPIGAAQAISQRCDVPFVRRMFQAVGVNPTETVVRNTARMDDIAWLAPQRTMLAALDDKEQAAAVNFVCKSGVSKDAKLDFLAMVFEDGNAGGRRNAARCLTEIRGPEANELMLDAFEYDDPRVQAILAPQLRARSLPGATRKLMSLADSSDAGLLNAVRDCMGEYNLSQFLDGFDTLDEESQWEMGAAVGKLDAHALEGLVAELEDSSRMSRVLALQAAPMLGLVDEIHSVLLDILGDEDALARSAAVTALGYCSLSSTGEQLEQMTHDESPSVAEAARQALQMWTQNNPQANGQAALTKEHV